MQVNETILANKKAITEIVKLALATMNEERKQKHSNHNLAHDLKDNLDRDFKDFCESIGAEYKRSGISQKLIINGIPVKIKMHTSLSKQQRHIIEKAEGIYEQLKFVTLEESFEETLNHEWEIGIELSSDRRTLKKIRLADFANSIVEEIYSPVAEIKETIHTQEQKVERNKFTSKITQEKESKLANEL